MSSESGHRRRRCRRRRPMARAPQIIATTRRHDKMMVLLNLATAANTSSSSQQQNNNINNYHPSIVLLKTTIVLLTLAVVAATVVGAQSQQQQHNNANTILQSSPSPLQPHQRSPTINNNNNNNINLLVNHEAPQALQASLSLPIIRQPMQADSIDNVIEPTTTMMTNNLQSILISSHQSSLLSTQQSQQQQQHAATTTTTCQLPPTWMGKWYQSNKEPIRVTNTEISDKGLCRDKKGDKYLLEYSKHQQQPCLVCLVINERHLNVLQYKESTCQPIPARYLNRTTNSLIFDNDHSLLDSICSDITGDAQLESLFRLDTPAIECPIGGKYHFTYDNCREPQSSLDSCIDKKQLNFKFSACPDMPGSESKSEVLKCYADWSEGNNYYMIGRLEHASNHQDKGKFRCFVYEKSPDGGIQMAQSLEESCYGLINANEGPKTLRLTVKQPTNHECYFPSFIQSQSENWLSVDNSLIYMFNQNSTKYQVKETKEGNVIEEATCLQQFHHPTSNQALPSASHPHILQQPQQQPAHLHHNNQNHHHHQQHARSGSSSSSNGQQQQVISTTPTSRRYPPSNFNHVDQSHLATRSIINDVVYLVQITKNCQTTDFCVRFYRRSSGIVQIDYFAALAGVGAGIQRCRNAWDGAPQTQIITSTSLENQRCPFEGVYTVEAPMESDLSYNPSNIFMCPRQSFLTAQCDHPSRLKIHYRCTPARYLTKNLYCLGSWNANGLVRLLLADDERQRYSAWYRDYGTLPAIQEQGDTTTNNNNYAQALALQQQQAPTRSQHLLGLSSSSQVAPQMTTNTIMGNAQYNTLTAPIVDLQIALITPMPTISKPMQVRLTRRNQCSELRGYSSQGSYGGGALMSSPASSSMQSYASPANSAASSIVTLQLSASLFSSSILIFFVTLTLIFKQTTRLSY